MQVEQLELALADIDELLAETGAVDVVATEQTIAQDRSRPAGRCRRDCHAMSSNTPRRVTIRPALAWPAAAHCGLWART